MSLKRLDLMKWNRISASLGGLVWLLALCVWIPGWLALDTLKVLLLLALLVIAPLAVPLAASPQKGRLHRSLYRLVVILQPFAALIGGASFFAGRGSVGRCCRRCVAAVHGAHSAGGSAAAVREGQRCSG